MDPVVDVVVPVVVLVVEPVVVDEPVDVAVLPVLPPPPPPPHPMRMAAAQTRVAAIVIPLLFINSPVSLSAKLPLGHGSETEAMHNLCPFCWSVLQKHRDVQGDTFSWLIQ